MSASGPQRTFVALAGGDRRGPGRPGQASSRASGGPACGRTPLRFSAGWPGAELAPFAALTLLRQTRRVRPRSALRARGTRSALLDAGFFMPGPPAPPPASRQHRGVPPNTPAASPQGGPGRRRRALEAASIAGRVASARSARPCLTRRVCPSAVSEANAASYAPGQPAEKRSGVRPQAGPPDSRGDACPGRPGPRRPSHTSATKLRHGPLADPARGCR